MSIAKLLKYAVIFMEWENTSNYLVYSFRGIFWQFKANQMYLN